MANKAFEIQGSTLRIGGVDLEAGRVAVVIPGVTQATTYGVEEVNDTDGEQTITFTEPPIIIDIVIFNDYVNNGSTAMRAEYLAELDDDSYIDEIKVISSGVYLGQDYNEIMGANPIYAYTGTAVDPFSPFVQEDWTSIPFRAKMEVGEVENIGGGAANLGDITVEDDSILTLEEGTLGLRSFDGNNETKIDLNGYELLLQASDPRSRNYNSGASDWVSASWVSGEGGSITFTGLEQYVKDFLNRTLNGAVNIRVQINGSGPEYEYFYFNGSDTIVLSGNPETSPTAVTDITWLYKIASKIVMYPDEGEFVIQSATGSDLDITAGDDLFMDANDDINLTGGGQIQIRSGTDTVRITTNYDIEANDPTRTWTFDNNGNLTLPEGGDIFDSTGTSVLGGTSGPTPLYITANTDGTVTTSTDGITWTEPFNTGINIGTVAVGPSKIIYSRSDVNNDGNSTGLYATQRANTAPTLIPGSDTDQGGDYYWLQVQYFDGTAYPWVAVGYRSTGGTNYPTITYSADGESWSYTSIAGDIGTTYADDGTNLIFTDIAYGNGVYVISASSNSGSGPKGGVWTLTDLTAEIAMINQVAIDDNFKTVEFMSSGGEGITNWAAFNITGGFWTTTDLDPTVLVSWSQWEPEFIAGLIFEETGLENQTIEETAAGVINGNDTWMTGSSNGHIVWWPNIPAGPYVSIPQPFTSAISDISRNPIPGRISEFTVSPTVGSQNTNWTSVPYDNSVSSGVDRFHIVIDGDGILTTCELTVSDVHEVNDTITLYGGAFGGTSGIDDIVITVTAIYAESPTTISFLDGGEGGNFESNGEKIVISGVTNQNASEPGTTDQSYNGTYYIKQVGSFTGYTYELYTDQALTTPWLTHTYWPVNMDTGIITWSHGEYLDALGYANGHFYVGNDNEQIFKSEFNINDGTLTWTKVSDLNDSLSYWNDIAYYSAFDSDTHGSISFNGADIRGAGNSNTAGFINLVPNSTLKSGGQYVTIYPTNQFDYPHVHIAAGEDGELYIGNDLQYVKTGIEGNIGISSYNSGTSATYEWNFGPDGTTAFPTLTVDLHNGGLQSGQVLQFGNSSLQSIITGPTPVDGDSAERLIIQGQRASGSGEGGDVYFWAGDAESYGGDIKIYAGDADSDTQGYGGYVNIQGGDGYNEGGNASLTGGYSANGEAGDVSISAGNSGNNLHGQVYINTSGHQWTFTPDGTTTLPGAVVKGTVANTGGAGDTYGVATAISFDPKGGLTPGNYLGIYVAVNGGITINAVVSGDGDLFMSVATDGGGNGHTVNDTFVLNGSSIGGATPADDVTVTITAVEDVLDTTALDLTKSVNKLTDGNYSLADGTEGQTMYLVRQTGSNAANIGVKVVHARVDGSTYGNRIHYPFSGGGDSLTTMIFTDGHWQSTNSAWSI